MHAAIKAPIQGNNLMKIRIGLLYLFFWVVIQMFGFLGGYTYIYM